MGTILEQYAVITISQSRALAAVWRRPDCRRWLAGTSRQAALAAAGDFVLMLVGAWFVCSGVIELFVSGMETVQRLSGVPDQATFTLWRGRADGALAVATGALLLVGVLVALSGKLSWRRNSQG